MKRHNSQKGFTLIEVMIALALLAMIMGLVSGSYYASARAKRRMESRMELIAMGRVALDTMIKEIDGALIVPDDTSSMPFEGETSGSFQNPQDSISFLTTTFNPTTLGGIGGNTAEISYELKENEKLKDSYFLDRRADPFPDDDPKKGGITTDIAEEVSGLQIRYQDDNDIWNNRWNSGTDKKYPKLVEITIHLRGEDGTIVQLRGVAAPMRWKAPAF